MFPYVRTAAEPPPPGHKTTGGNAYNSSESFVKCVFLGGEMSYDTTLGVLAVGCYLDLASCVSGACGALVGMLGRLFRSCLCVLMFVRS